MSQAQPQMLRVEAGGWSRDIAVLRDAGGGPGLFWLGGFRSEMSATKASALAAFARRQGRGVTRFDYSGHGASEGTFVEGTIGRWLDEADAVFSACTSGPQVLVGSSMGGWIALLLAERLRRRGEAARLAALVLVAPATDMTETLIWRSLPEAARNELVATGFFTIPSKYSTEPTVITRALIEEGRNHLFGDRPIVAGCPVAILHGAADPDVPIAMSVDLVSQLAEDAVTLTVIKDGDHRLSRPQDIERLVATVAAIA